MTIRLLCVPTVGGCSLLFATIACSAVGSGNEIGGGNSSGGGGFGGGGSGAVLNVGGYGAGNTIDPPCNNTPGSDVDGDGFTNTDGDCNDCSVHLNPGAFDFSGNGIDEDCNGTADDEPHGCDAGLLEFGNDPLDAARAIGLCRTAVEGAVGAQRTWGVISAAYVFADGSVSSGKPGGSLECTGPGGFGAPPNPLSHGVLPRFGLAVYPRDGEAMLALSSGVAREGVNGASPGGANMCTKSATPPHFPTPSTAACPDTDIDDTPVAIDPMALELKIRTPSNAKSLSFDFNFYTFEYPLYICSTYNDFFVALVESRHPASPSNKNVCFDRQGNHVSVNNGFLEVCNPGKYGGKEFTCPLGTAELSGTGFEDRAATGWLQTTTPIIPGDQITIRFAIWDMGDEILDSTVLVDNFAWIADEEETGTNRPPPK